MFRRSFGSRALGGGVRGNRDTPMSVRIARVAADRRSDGAPGADVPPGGAAAGRIRMPAAAAPGRNAGTTIGMPPPILRLQGVHFRFASSAPVIVEVDLSLNGGDIVVVRGRNGAGKSTLLRLAAGCSVPLADAAGEAAWSATLRNAVMTRRPASASATGCARLLG